MSVYLTSEYNAWKAMKARCNNPNHPSYKNYGKRGIRVCFRWRHFTNFLADMGLRPSPKHTLERVRNSCDYEPWNCVWTTRRVQQRNTRRNRWITCDGRRQLAIDWARERRIAPSTLHYRLERMSASQALGFA